MRQLEAQVLDLARRRPHLSAERIGVLLSASHTTVRQMLRRHGIETPQIVRDAPPSGLLDEARAEFAASRSPLVVESLEERLERALPGASLSHDASRAEPWEVRRNRVRLALGVSARDAIDRATMLWGRR